jgi:hypothetical protein
MVLQDSENPNFSFSTDSRWALVYDEIEAEDPAAPDQTTLYVISTADGRIIHQVEQVIEAIFSPDNSQLAYSVVQLDGTPAIYILDLGTEVGQFLGEGVVNTWLLTELRSGAVSPTPAAKATEETTPKGQTGDTIAPPPTPTSIPSPIPREP